MKKLLTWLDDKWFDLRQNRLHIERCRDCHKWFRMWDEVGQGGYLYRNYTHCKACNAAWKAQKSH